MKKVVAIILVIIVGIFAYGCEKQKEQALKLSESFVYEPGAIAIVFDLELERITAAGHMRAAYKSAWSDAVTQQSNAEYEAELFLHGKRITKYGATAEPFFGFKGDILHVILYTSYPRGEYGITSAQFSLTVWITYADDAVSTIYSREFTINNGKIIE